MDKKFFTLPKVSKCESYIYFSFWNPKEWRYQRFKKHLSRKIPQKDRRAELQNLLIFWTTGLRNGYNPFIAILPIIYYFLHSKSYRYFFYACPFVHRFA